jgi:CheY-like chemotaxis protein
LSGLRVLVIDDLAEAREVFSAMLQSWGAQVDTASTAASGLAALGRFKPDVVLCDIAMPGENGFSFIRRVRALEPSQGGKTVVVALTAFAGAEDAQRSLDAGFDAHLAKPVDATDLSRLIAKLAGRVKEQS